jgi:hypothetical protein
MSDPAEPEYETALRAELERRIAALAAEGDASFGSIGRGEWVVIILVTIVLPLIAVWAFR